MSSFVGYANLNRDLSKNVHIIKDMNFKTQKGNLNKEDYFIDTNINIGYKTNDENSKQLLRLKYNDITYTIIFNGQIYNKDEIKKELQELGYEFTRLFRYRSITEGICSFWD